MSRRKKSPPPAIPSSPGIVQSGRRGLGTVALLVVLTCAAYWPSLRGGFLWDDDVLLTNSSMVKAPDGLYRIWFTTEPVDYWPMTNTSFWLEWRLWGLHATGYHVTNLTLHIANAFLLWAILRRLRIPGAWLAALIFGVHPVNVESVAWIAQRKNTLSMLFFLSSILWYLKAEIGGPRRWYWFSVLAFALAMLSKASVVVLPAVLLLIVWWRRDRITRSDVVRTLPFVLVAIGLTLVSIAFQARGAEEAIRHATAAERMLGAGAIVWFYLYKALLPIHLVFVYPQWQVDAGDVRWWVPLAAAVAATSLLVWQRRRPWGRALLFAWLFFCVALLPVMGFVDIAFMRYSLVADHYQYIAIIGVIALAAAAVDRTLA
jgi:hypothetical protein